MMAMAAQYRPAVLPCQDAGAAAAEGPYRGPKLGVPEALGRLRPSGDAPEAASLRPAGDRRHLLRAAQRAGDLGAVCLS
jgi:hypothetical protein